jgi:hypothetical protein
MTSIEIRIAMSENGWNSEEEISDIGWGGKRGFKCAFYRFDWHGKFSDKIYFVKSTNDLTKTQECVELAANLAKEAWDKFPDSVPYYSATGKLIKDDMKTEFWRDAPTFEEMISRHTIKSEEKRLRKKDKIQLTNNQYRDMKALYENRYIFDGKIHRAHCWSDQDDIKDLVQTGLVEYVEEFRFGNLMLKLTKLGCMAVQNDNITTREP